MKILLSLILLILGSFSAFAQSDPISAFELKWQNSKNYLIEIAEAMPEEQYPYKPSERQMSFSEQLLHIRRNMLWLSHEYIAEQDFEEPGLNKDLSKEETLSLLASAFDTVSAIVAKMNERELSEEVEFKARLKTKLQILNLIQDHATHHRGQLIVYLNLQGIEPPGYVGW